MKKTSDMKSLAAGLVAAVAMFGFAATTIAGSRSIQIEPQVPPPTSQLIEGKQLYTYASPGPFAPATLAAGTLIRLQGNLGLANAQVGVAFVPHDMRYDPKMTGWVWYGAGTKSDAYGNYSIEAYVPAEAKPGVGYFEVTAGFNPYHRNPQGPFTVAPPTTANVPSSWTAGAGINLAGTAIRGTELNALFVPGDRCMYKHAAQCAGDPNAVLLGRTTVDQRGNYALGLKLPVNAPTGFGHLILGCDTCGNGWIYRRFAVTQAAAAPAPMPAQPPAQLRPTAHFSTLTARPGDTVTVAGRAAPNSSMSAYFSCKVNCGQVHLGVAPVDRNGQYALSFKVPPAAKGAVIVQIGCDKCGNGWTTVQGLTVR